MNLARRILITGGASGVGEHIAKQFLENGDRVTVIDHNAKAVELAVESKRADYGFTCDVSNTELVEEILNKDMEENGAYEVIVNNVGISVRERTLRILIRSFGETYSTLMLLVCSMYCVSSSLR